MGLMVWKSAVLAGLAASALVVCALLASSQPEGLAVELGQEKHQYNKELNSYGSILSFPPAHHVVKQKGVEDYGDILSFSPEHGGGAEQAVGHKDHKRVRKVSKVAKLEAISEAKGQAKELQHILNMVQKSEKQINNSPRHGVSSSKTERPQAAQANHPPPTLKVHHAAHTGSVAASKSRGFDAKSAAAPQHPVDVKAKPSQPTASQLERRKEQLVWQQMEQSMEAELQRKKAKCVRCLENWSPEALSCVKETCDPQIVGQSEEDSAQLKLNNQIASLLHQCMGGPHDQASQEAAKRVVVDSFVLPWKKPFAKKESHSWVKVRWTGEGLHGLGLVSGNTQSVILRGKKTASGARLFCRPGITLDDQLRPLMAEQHKINRDKAMEYYKKLAANHDALMSMVDTALAKDGSESAVLSWMALPKKQPESAWKVGLSKVDKKPAQKGTFDPQWAPTVAQHERIKHHVMDRTVKRRLREEMKVVKLERQLRQQRETLEHPDRPLRERPQQQSAVGRTAKKAGRGRRERRLERRHYQLLATLRKLKSKIARLHH